MKEFPWKKADDAKTRLEYRALFEKEANPSDPVQTVIFAKMDETVDVHEITTECWDILGKKLQAIMCSSSRMVVKRKALNETRVIACTLASKQEEFYLGSSLKEARKPVFLNYPHRAKFCVLSGASCAA